MLDTKELKVVNKAYDALYDCVNSRYNREKICTPAMLESMEKKMKSHGYKVKINAYQKAVFKREK